MSITSHYPTNLQTDVIRNPYISIQFDVDLDRTTINEYTVILVNTLTQQPVAGVVDYIVGTRTISFQLFDFLAEDTNYTMIVVGGTSGVYKLMPHVPFNATSYTFSFTIGNSIDWTKPLAVHSGFEDGPYFDGELGIYREVFGRTGEPVTHIVTTGGTVGPSGTIEPTPWGPDRYIPPPTTASFTLSYTNPADGESWVTDKNITFVFNDNVASVADFDILVEDRLGAPVTAENNMNNYHELISNKVFRITPSGVLSGLRNNSVYTVTLTNVEDHHSRKISSVVITFRTALSPFYTSVKLIRTNLGPFLKNVTDQEIEDVILENSLYIYEVASRLTSTSFPINQPTQAAIMYVICKTKLDLIYRQFLVGGIVQSKKLADLQIAYGTRAEVVLQDKINDYRECVEQSEIEVQTGTKYMQMRSAVKSHYDPRNMWNSANGWKRLHTKNFDDPDEEDK